MTNRREDLARKGYTAIQCLLVVLVLVFIFAHVMPPSVQGITLNPSDNYISQYAVSSSLSWAFQSVIVAFGLILLVLSYALLRRLSLTRSSRLGAIILAVSATTMIFVAIYPTRPVLPSKNASWWDAVTSFFSKNVKPPDATTEAFAGVHDLMIKVSSIALVVAIGLFAYAALRENWPRYGITGIAAAGLALLLSIPMIFSPNWMPGLWQRASFVVLFFWVFSTVIFLKRHSVYSEEQNAVPGKT